MPRLVQGGVSVRNTNGFPAVAVALSSPLAMVGQSGVTSSVTYGEMALSWSGVTAGANALFDRMWMQTYRRSGSAAGRMHQTLGFAPGIHHLVDPTTAKHPVTLIMEDYVSGVIAAGACELVFGIGDHITPGDPTTLVGIGFHAAADHVWHTFVNDCPANVAPVTVRRDTALPGQLATNLLRLAIVLDGPTKTITWLINGLVVDRWQPSAPLDRMGTSGPLTLWAASVPALGDATVRSNGGGIPQLRLLVR